MVKHMKLEKLMLDSGTIPHMTPNEEEVQHRRDSSVPISLGNDPKVAATERGIRSVHPVLNKWSFITSSLSNT